MRRYLINTIENMRDIGGYPITNEKYIADQKIVRSNEPTQITQEDMECLLKLNIKTIIDLRREEELEKTPSKLQTNENFKFFHYPIYKDKSVPKNSEEVADSYIKMLDSKESIYAIFKTIETSQDGILYYCHSGKDRTGVVTYLILSILGVKKEDIITDYELSTNYLDCKLKKYAQENANVSIDAITPKKEHMERFIEKFKQQYGSVEKYLLEIGIGKEDIAMIQEKLIKSI